MTTATISAPTAAARRRRRQNVATRTITAAIYTRLSMDRSGEGTAVARQLADAKAMAALKGWTVPDELIFSDNDRSASNGKTRPEFERLVKAIATDKCQAVVVWHMDRLVRLTTDLLRVIEAGRDNGFSITSVQGPSLDMSDPTGVAVAQILVAIAEMEVKHKADRQFRANLAQREAGVMPWKRAFGYDSVTSEIIESEAELVREIFARFNAGAGVWTIAKWLIAEGTKNSVGTAWTRQQVRDLLSNARYIAKSTLADGYRQREIIGDGNWQPIISEAVFRTAVNRLNDPARLARGRKGCTRKWVGAGFYRCDVCGSKVISTYSSGSAINPETGKPAALRVYKCKGHIHRPADEADDYTTLAITKFLDDHRGLWERLADDGNAGKVGILRVERAEQEALLGSMHVEMGKSGRRPAVISQLAKAADDVADRIDEIDQEMDSLGESSPLARLAGAKHPGIVWHGLDVNSKIAVGNAICEIRLSPLRPGRRPKTFDVADSITITFSGSSSEKTA